jgi:predicted 3-demethylubiquinone-9 3-methyltransferase (glyoxalase superfamily)
MYRQKITPFLWFASNALEAAEFYVSLFPNSGIDSILPGPDGKPLLVAFHLGEMGVCALNGNNAPVTFTDAVSLAVACDTQAEVDRLWDALMEGGSSLACGWLHDRFGVSWQITPKELPGLLSDPDPARAGRAMQAMMGMIKLDIAAIQRAADGEPEA